MCHGLISECRTVIRAGLCIKYRGTGFIPEYRKVFGFDCSTVVISGPGAVPWQSFGYGCSAVPGFGLWVQYSNSVWGVGAAQ